jgi:hypothetical protein
MSALTIRLNEEKHQRLRQMAKSKGTTINGMFDEMATILLVNHDAENRFLLRAARGLGQENKGLALLAKARSNRSPNP